MSDYIHRVGRVGRVGSSSTGTVHSYISQKWEVDLLWKIEVSCTYPLNYDKSNWAIAQWHTLFISL